MRGNGGHARQCEAGGSRPTWYLIDGESDWGDWGTILAPNLGAKSAILLNNTYVLLRREKTF